MHRTHIIKTQKTLLVGIFMGIQPSTCLPEPHSPIAPTEGGDVALLLRTRRGTDHYPFLSSWDIHVASPMPDYGRMEHAAWRTDVRRATTVTRVTSPSRQRETVNQRAERPEGLLHTWLNKDCSDYFGHRAPSRPTPPSLSAVPVVAVVGLSLWNYVFSTRYVRALPDPTFSQHSAS